MIVNRYTNTTRRGALRREAEFVAKFLSRSLRNGFRHKTILFYPEYPDRRAAVVRVADSLGFNLTNNPRLKCDMAFHWKDCTYREPCALLEGVAKKVPVFNLRCRDISKQRVEEAFVEVFGYGSFVDPTSYEGVCVRKSELNAVHDGILLECPIKVPEEGYIYQKLVNQVNHEQLAVDYRVAVFGDALAAFATREKRLHDRFAHTIRETLVDHRAYISEEEARKIVAFCRLLGLDYGELDMIRDQDDGRLYLLDANNTPFRPPPQFNVTDDDRREMLDKYQRAFREQFLGERPLTGVEYGVRIY